MSSTVRNSKSEATQLFSFHLLSFRLQASSIFCPRILIASTSQWLLNFAEFSLKVADFLLQKDAASKQIVLIATDEYNTMESVKMVCAD
jgi:hypothetical protein